MKKYIITLLFASLLNGCATDPYTGERTIADSGIGAGLGALAGAGIGAIAGDGKGALIGAGIGALAGGGAGAYMDSQSNKLRQELVGTGVQVVKEGCNIRLIMPGNITFQTDSYYINPSFNPVLDSISKVIAEYSKTIVKVSGYTDSTGSKAYNNTLSLQRANAVSNFLQLRGVSGNRILVNGYGEQNPIATNDTAAGREQNRRVEIVLVNPECK